MKQVFCKIRGFVLMLGVNSILSKVLICSQQLTEKNVSLNQPPPPPPQDPNQNNSHQVGSGNVKGSNQMAMPGNNSNNQRFHPYQRSNSQTEKVDPRLRRQSNDVKHTPTDPRQRTSQAAVSNPPKLSQVNISRDPRRR